MKITDKQRMEVLRADFGLKESALVNGRSTGRKEI